LEICEVQNSWNNRQEAATQFPPSELNPLTNATLGQNLGRWAQVYFTTPPEEREQAVGRLLRELENENRVTAPAPVTTMMKSAPPTIVEDFPEQLASQAERYGDVLCSTCQHRNPVDQRFCGTCGSPLHGAQRNRSDEPFAPLPLPETVATTHPESDVQWLRERAVASLEASDHPKSHAWIYLLTCVVVLLAGIGYLQWASQHDRPSATTVATRGAASEPSVTASQPRVQIDPPRPIQAQSTAEVQPAAGKSPTVQTPLATRENASRKPVETSLGSAAQNARARALSSESPSAPSPEANLDSEGGAQELRLAERYLEGKSGARDTTEAGKWLWKAVGKENSTAAVLLADLYARGDGVPKNCDQARILLVSATKKGASQAAHALRNLETNGCQ
jgi:hypothetical protein